MLRSTLAASVLLLASSAAVTSAHALEGKALLDSYLEKMGSAAVTITYGNLVEDGASFTMQDAVITNPRGQKTNVEAIVVKGLRQAAAGRISYESVVLSGISGQMRGSDGTLSINAVASNNGEWPADVWAGGLTADERKQRITFDSFSINGVQAKSPEVSFNLESFGITGADIPLDFRLTPEMAALNSGEPAEPMVMKSVALTGFDGTQAGVEFSLGTIAVSNLSFPTSFSVLGVDDLQIYSAAAFKDFLVKQGGTTIMSLADLSGTITPADSSGTITGTSNIDGLYVNLKAVPDREAQKVFDQLGYDKIEMTATGVGTYNPNTGVTDVTNTVFKLKNMFDLAFNYRLEGYTLDVINQLNAANQKIESGTPMMQAYMAILPTLSQVKLSNLSLALTDQSITGRALDFQASQMNTTGDQLAQGAPMMIGMGLAGLQMPALTEMVTKAVGDFLRDKGTLTVEANPAEPVSIVTMVMSGQSNPKVIPEMLNLQMTATPK
ncbi:MAG: hypothetical protein AAFO73_01455 [Pseudomonadota bacterium]